MKDGGTERSGGSKGRVESFGSRPFVKNEAVRALDSVVDGLRTLSVYAGQPEDQIVATKDFSQLVEDAASGMPRLARGARRRAYNTLFVAVGERCRQVLDGVHHPAAVPAAADPVVAASLSRELVRSRGGAATLLRMAVAAELSGVGDTELTGRRAPLASRNPLRGVLDLYAMGAVLTGGADGEAPTLAMGNGERLTLEWTGGMLSRQAAGRLRPAPAVDLSF